MTFDLLFYYKAREKLRNNHLLSLTSPKLHDYILGKYTKSNYKLINNIFIAAKILIFTLIYSIIIFTTEFNKDSLLTNSLGLFFFFSYFVALLMITSNKESLKNIEHDHYFRMLAENRNELIRISTTKTINYSILNWLMPLTMPLFIITALTSDLMYFAYYLGLLLKFYLLLYIVVFGSQKLLFRHLKKSIIIKDLLIFLFAFVIVGVLFSLHIIIVNLSLIKGIFKRPYLGYIVITILVIALLYLVKRLVKKHSLKYSLTDGLIVKNTKKYKNNKITKPPFLIKLFHKKDKDANIILTKDLLTYYRSRKDEFYGMIIFQIMMIAITGMFISFLEEGSTIFEAMGIESIFTGVIMILLITVISRYKDNYWYSSESKNLDFFKKLEIKPISIYNAKVTFFKVLTVPTILIYTLLPLVFISRYDYNLIYYVFLRIPIIFLYSSVLLKYQLINDAKKSVFKLKKLFFRGVDLIILILFIQIIGLSILFMTTNNTKTIFNVNPLITTTVLIIAFIFLLINKILQYRTKNKILNHGGMKNG